jgi:hypothetical protein
MNDELLNYADALAALSNLKLVDAKSFSRRHQKFLPEPAFLKIQAPLRDLWSQRFPLADAVETIVTIEREVIRAVLKRIKNDADKRSVPLDERITVAPGNWHFQTSGWPAQYAIMFLATQPWRARFCSSCGRRFVADKPSRRYCGELCSHEARKKGKLTSWRNHGKAWRANQKRREKKRKSRKSN